MFRKGFRFALLLLTTVSLVTVRAPADTTTPAPDPVPTATGLPEALADSVKPVLSRQAASLSALRPTVAQPLRVLLISSGIDASVFSESLRTKLVWATDSSEDSAGYGTYAATALLQLTSSISITSYSAYGGSKFDADRHDAALAYALAHARDFDAVLDAVPSAELLDPTTLLMARTASDGSSQWSNVLAAIGDNSIVEGSGSAFGIALDAAKRATQMKHASTAQRVAADYYAAAVLRWQGTRAKLAALSGKGLPVVVPAGDLGPGFQTIFGIANLPEVITVGAFDGRSVATTSSSGPSIDMHSKPDVVASGNLVGLLPKSSTLDQKLPINNALVPVFADGSKPAGGDAVRVDSTVPAAAVIATQLAVLASNGIRDAKILRGALTLAAKPIDGVPVWRQGAGVFTRQLRTAEVLAAGVPVSSGDLGSEPATGAWKSTIVFSGARPLGARTTLTDFAGVGPDGEGDFHGIGDGGSIVDVSISTDGGVVISTGLGERYDGGLFCGYTLVSLPGTGNDINPFVSADGLPPGVREHVPTCLLNGSKLVMHGFYIHDEPAENLTFALLPDLPARDTVMSQIPRHVPMDPFDTQLYQQVTGADGDAVLLNAPPAYYRIRQFSDYGAPISYGVKDAQGKTVTLKDDIGDNPSYQDVPAFLLSAVNLTADDLKKTFGPENVALEKPTGAYIITVGGVEIRVVLNWMKKMPGPAVTSRYVDLIDRSDLRFLESRLPGTLASAPDPAGLIKTLYPLAHDGWLYEGVNAPAPSSLASSEISARYNPTVHLAGTDLIAPVGVAQYPFSLTQPSYTAHLSVNFTYDVNLAAVAILVQIGPEVGYAIIGDGDVIATHTYGGGEKTIPDVKIVKGGRTGNGGFDFALHTHGLGQGTLTFLFIPGQTIARDGTAPSHVDLKDVSLRVSTWTTSLWPATMNAAGMGHAFDVSPNVSWQMNHPECRSKSVGGYSYDECEDWQVMVHSPGSDASMVSVRRQGADLNDDLVATGGEFFDPQRGTSVFSSSLVRLLPGTTGATSKELRTNGRFWEQLAVPLTFLKLHPGALHFEIVDNVRGRDSTMLPHELGGVRVAPYIPYTFADSGADIAAQAKSMIPAGPPKAPGAPQPRPIFATGASSDRSEFICDLV
ncbi:MAG: S8 family serine peptidase [Actinomycetota bacterium]|nr:S8 family serine peptidase [Actinomycetota bacterium]